MRLRISGSVVCGHCRVRMGLILLLLLSSLSSLVIASEKWPGVDESVVEKYAKEHGREAHEPLINTDKGDLLLFAFLVAGVVGGFAAGYYWRVLTERRVQSVGQSLGDSEPTEG